jgi:hypothetical protein
MKGSTAANDAATTPTGTPRWGWWIHVAVASLLVLNGAGLYLLIVETQTERTIGLLLTSVGVLALLTAVDGLRSGAPLPRRVGWTVTAILAAIGLHSLGSERLDLVGFYLGLAAVAAVGAVLTRPRLEGTS